MQNQSKEIKREKSEQTISDRPPLERQHSMDLPHQSNSQNTAAEPSCATDVSKIKGSLEGKPTRVFWLSKILNKSPGLLAL